MAKRPRLAVRCGVMATLVLVLAALAGCSPKSPAQKAIDDCMRRAWAVGLPPVRAAALCQDADADCKSVADEDGNVEVVCA